MRFFCFILFLTLSIEAKAQFVSANAYAEALSGTMTTETGLKSVGYNPAGIYQTGYGFSLSYFDRYQVKEISQKSLAAAVPALNGCFSMSFDYYGFNLFNRTSAGLGYAMSLSKQLKAGVKINYHGLNVGNSTEKFKALSGEIGIICYPVKRFEIGAYIKNPTNSQFNSSDSIIPVSMSVGVKRIFFVKGFASLEVEKNSLNKQMEIKIGAGCPIKKFMEFEWGLSTLPLKISLGLGFKKDNYKLYFAVSRNVYLGYMPSITAAWSITKQEKK